MGADRDAEAMATDGAFAPSTSPTSSSSLPPLASTKKKSRKKEKRKEERRERKSERKKQKKRRRTLGGAGDDAGEGFGGDPAEERERRKLFKKNKKRRRSDGDGVGEAAPPSTKAEDGPSTVAAAMDLAGKNSSRSPWQSPSSPFHIQTLSGSIAVLPSSLADVRASVVRNVNSLLLSYHSRMGGVLLAFDRDGIDLSSSSLGGGEGRIVDDLPHVHYAFVMRCLVFCPRVGMRLCGTVVESNSSHVSLTVRRILALRVPSAALRSAGYAFDRASSVWTRERNDDGLGPASSIGPGDDVDCEVSRVHECGGIISLDGKNPSVAAGCD